MNTLPSPHQNPTGELKPSVPAEASIDLDSITGVNPLFLDKVDDDDFLRVLLEHCDATGEDASEYLINSSRFADLLVDKTTNGLLGEAVTIDESAENLHEGGSMRRTESGRIVNVIAAEQAGLRPDRVLFFRVTQPASGEPKPEYYWTSDLQEARSGLSVELGDNAATAIVLVSTLDVISKNGGLMADVNDDQGLAVRQIGLQTFDQSQALGQFSRAA